MPKYTFQDSENKASCLPEGDYIVTVNGYKFGLSKNGNDKLDLELVADGGTLGQVKLYDCLTFTEKAAFRIDTFLKSISMAPKKGETINFDESFAQSLFCCRGWATLGTKDYNGKKFNTIAAWLTNKEKLPKAENTEGF